ncbi:Kinesin motor domain-containing protein [Aphelenchoides bicaudatus]|nr:Kinesin motor domain-containing protein [Aphelenchoides bicaudatus]
MTVQSPSGTSDQVKVAIRVRPFSKRENDLGTKGVVSMQNSQTILHNLKETKQSKVFAFDNCFDSSDPQSSEFANQELIFEAVGVDVVDNAFNGYNACVLAYGQTGSGKSYTMMGSPTEPGLIPRLCDRIFGRIDEETNDQTKFKVEVSYLEIYNEKVHDLLDPKNSNKRPLKVREHTLLGVIVDGLSVLAVSSFEQITQLMDEGNKCRTVAATNMNSESSRSHAVFTLHLTQIVSDVENSFTGEKCSKISLVDLAGSERAQKSGAIGKRLEEGGNINKSLTTLGMVISALADKSNGKKEKFVPYRDSVLTWLLKDNLGGNSKTVMVATISPAADNYEETLSTLRYADRAKRIVNHAVVNEDPNAKIIRELRDEVELLRLQINQNQERQNEAEELRNRLAESEHLIEMMNKTWEERLLETERLTVERQKDFAEIGICVADAGIKVQKDRFYLVNLNADPSMSELLVYYINQRAVIGNQEGNSGESSIDFVFQGLGVQPKHAVLEILSEEEKPKLYISLLTDNARVCVNGLALVFGQKLQLKNGDRLLIGNNHLFRVNSPRDEDEINNQMNSSICSAHFDYNRAWLEANADADSSQNPVKAVDQYIEQITIKHEEEKQAALEKQYEEFERYLHGLTHNLQTPSTPMTPAMPFAGLPTPSLQLPPVTFNSVNPRSQKSNFLQWAKRREELLKESLCQLKTDIVKANALVREANLIAEELWGKRRGFSHYEVTLQIPVQNLRPSKINTSNTVCEPVIVVKRHGMAGHQIWSTEQLENKLIDMREIYTEKRIGNMEMTESTGYVEGSCSSSSGVLSGDECGDLDNEKPNPLMDTLFESQEKHTLIGVANVFLEVLFHDLRLDYQVPIISQQGEASGKLHIEIYRLPDNPSTNGDSNENNNQSNAFLGRTIRCRVRIKKATNLPPQLSHFVFCQYGFFNATDMLVIAPSFDEEQSTKSAPKNSFKFDHQKDHIIQVTEEFLEYVQNDALSIEVWGHRSCGFDHEMPVDEHFLNSSANGAEIANAQKQKRLQELWAGVIRRIEFWVEIKELNENGEYENVDVNPGDVATGGIYQLKQQVQRRLSVRLRQSTEKGGLPLTFADITTVALGSLTVQGAQCNSEDYQLLDSYQEQGLEQIRTQWTKSLNERQQYLNMQISASNDPERESTLIQQLMLLTEERNAVLLPAPNSNIPGAPCDWSPPAGIEKHIPVVFLDVNADELTGDTDCDLLDNKVAGLSSILPRERYDQMVLLPIVEKDTIEMSATSSWDSSLHNEPLLNKANSNGELIFAVVRVLVRLSYPFNTEVVLRKRICMSVYKKPSFKDRLLRKIVDTRTTTGTGVYYDVVASIPKSDMEDRASLALMAARHDQNKATPGDKSAYVEAYIKSIQAVEWMLKLDRLRQESAVLNMLSRHEKAQRLSYGMNGQSNFRMKRTISLPNTISNLTLPPVTPKQQEASKSHENGASVQNKLMDVSTSSTSSGYSSMVNSLVMNNSSPVAETSKLSGIDEEIQSDELTVPIRSSTVPESLFNGQLDSVNGNSPFGNFSCTNHLFRANPSSPNGNNNENNS